jgi:hypothetical protein
MSHLVEFISAGNWQEKVYINPDDVIVIKRYHRDRDLGEYSTLTMRTGETVNVDGLPTRVAKEIQNGKLQG